MVSRKIVRSQEKLMLKYALLKKAEKTIAKKL